MIIRKRLLLTGLIQGVGFRPAVYKLATRFGLAGFVYNDTKGVTIEAQGDQQGVEGFIEALNCCSGVPAMAKIKSLESEDIPVVEGENEFIIRHSDSMGTALSEVSGDIATCADCLAEMRDENNFRYRYPFINCTNCGPRYSIVKTIPYDRPNTTMSQFKMCPKCLSQYEDVNDRRFHAQPVACPKCGPKIWLCDGKGQIIEKDSDKAIALTAQYLKDGKIAAIKGVGGFHLAVNALDDKAVARLRKKKHREHKPFAMMANSIEQINKYAVVDEAVEKLLKSPQSPIVLLPKKENDHIGPAVASGVSSYGFMLCYAPLHWLLFDEGLETLVMTSGNISDEPLICKNDIALKRLGGIADIFLMHDREIFRQVDDSIVHFIDDTPVLLRRARGYVPAPVAIEKVCDKDIFATGPDLKNTFCFVKANQLIVSEHIGDMEDASVYRHYIESVKHLAKLFEVEPKVIACDLHPGYFSSRYAKDMKGVEIIEVQHHWAHIASVLAEHGLDEKVVGLSCDGTGYGTDGAIWGCECMVADFKNFERVGHLKYYPLAGGDLASKEAIRPLIGLLMIAYGDEFELEKFSWMLGKIDADKQKQNLIYEQILKSLNVTNTSSLGRVFDAVAAMAGIGNYNNFEAELPIALEALANTSIEQAYEIELADSEPMLLNIGKLIRAVVGDVKNGLGADVISAKFHNALASGLCQMALEVRDITNIQKVALSGGVFCNRYLTNRLIKLLKQAEFTVLFNSLVPNNDGGISLGQAIIAANRS